MTPLAALIQEHRNIERLLDIVQRWCTAFKSGGGVSPDDMEKALFFIRDYADRWHHGREEDLLFPAIAAANEMAEQSVLRVMNHEHDEGRALVGLASQANEERRAGDAKAVSRMVANLSAFDQLLRHHIYKEDNILYRMAEQWMSEEAMLELGTAFETQETKLGVDTPGRCLQLLAELERIDPMATASVGHSPY